MRNYLMMVIVSMKNCLIKIIRWYQRMPISSHSNCKFIPSCSEYMIECLNVYGVFKGLPKGIWRILRCNPFNKGGYDPVIKK